MSKKEPDIVTQWRIAKMECAELNRRFCGWYNSMRKSIKEKCGQDISAVQFELGGWKFRLWSNALEMSNGKATIWFDRSFDSNWDCKLRDLQQALIIARFAPFSIVENACLDALRKDD